MSQGRLVALFLRVATATLSLQLVGCGSSPDVITVYRQGMEFRSNPEMVMIISFDGLRPDAIAAAGAKHIQSISEAGVSAKTARTIVPSLTLPSHSSMLTGVSLEKHGIDWNEYQPQRGTVRVTTLFDEAKRKGLRTAMIVGKEKFQHLNHPGSVDRFVFEKGDPSRLADAAIRTIREVRPHVLFLHFPHPDQVGHKKGWMSGDQMDAIHKADQALGSVFHSLQEQGLLSSTTVIATADHGGSGKGHGDASEVSTRIPWVAAGAGISKRGALDAAITTYDTAATAAGLLQIPIPSSWDGKPVFQRDTDPPSSET